MVHSLLYCLGLVVSVLGCSNIYTWKGFTIHDFTYTTDHLWHDLESGCFSMDVDDPSRVKETL